MNVPFDREALAGIARELDVDVRRASIRDMDRLVNTVEERLGVRYIRMEFGIPGLPTPEVAIEAEIQALKEQKLGHIYAPFAGVPSLKEEISRFARLFMGVDIPADCCIPTVGAMQGCFASIALASRMRKDAGTVLFLEPGFPVNKRQVKLLGIESDSIDFYDHRGPALIEAIERRAQQGDLCAIIWSSPNNPCWIVLNEEELAGIGRICDEHELLAIEDLAYFGMDTRQNYFVPGEPPYQPTVLRHTRRGISIISSSKIFSYAGQRIAMAILSAELWDTDAPELAEYCGTEKIGRAFVPGLLYPMTACCPESPQYGLRAILQAANGGDSSLFHPAAEYSRRAREMKRLFLDNGFRLVYDNDLGEPLADGFYFTIAHPAYDDGADLIAELLHYGISAITLETTGSVRREGLRACVSLTGDELFPLLEERLRRFAAAHA